MNIYQVHGAYQFQVYNLLGCIDGHVTVIIGRTSGHYVFKKHGGYQTLTTYKPLSGAYKRPTPVEAALLSPIIDKILNNAEPYRRGVTPQKTNLIFTVPNLVY